MSGIKNIAFFGATGGVTSSCLSLTLRAGHACSALVRTPSKLTDLLSSKYSINDPTNLTIHSGNAKDLPAVTATLTTATGHLPDIIIFGIGGVPSFKPNPLRPTLDDPHVCESTSGTVITALRNLESEGKTTSGGGKPVMCIVSTTGIPPGPRDIPLGWIPLYHWLLPVPHADKQKMEELVEKSHTEGVISDFVMVRPTLLTDAARTYGKVYAGYLDRAEGGEGSLKMEDGGCGWKGNKGLAIGYLIGREDVGAWMFEEVVVKGGGEWKGKRVTLTT